jgi:transcriptional regulator with XRE-family HTH domain
MKPKNSPTPPAPPVSEQLKAIIRGKGLTAYAVAQSAGLAVASIQRYLNGERGLSTTSFDRVCEVLDLELRKRPRDRRGRATSPRA